MLKTLTNGLATVRLADFGAVRVQGADSRRFLQGQLSNDTEKLTSSASQLAGVHTPQGRAIAVLRLVAIGPDDVLAILPRELAAPVAARLAKYVLRAKAKVTDASAEWDFFGLMTTSDAGASAHPRLPTRLGEQVQLDASVVVCVDEATARWLVAAPSGQALAVDAGVNERERWRALDIAAGIPQVYGATTEAFVAQMLNLDILGGIAFDKGCYTGQEVIARAHYRGRVKRRMQRFRTLSSAKLSAGDSCRLRDGRSARVVDAVQLPDGRCEFLAVAPMIGAGAEETADAAATPANDSAVVLDVEPLSLPYSLPA